MLELSETIRLACLFILFQLLRWFLQKEGVKSHKKRSKGDSQGSPASSVFLGSIHSRGWGVFRSGSGFQGQQLLGGSSYELLFFFVFFFQQYSCALVWNSWTKNFKICLLELHFPTQESDQSGHLPLLNTHIQQLQCRILSDQDLERDTDLVRCIFSKHPEKIFSGGTRVPLIPVIRPWLRIKKNPSKSGCPILRHPIKSVSSTWYLHCEMGHSPRRVASGTSSVSRFFKMNHRWCLY